MKNKILTVEIGPDESAERAAKIVALLATVKPKRIIGIVQNKKVTYYKVTPKKNVSKVLKPIRSLS